MSEKDLEDILGRLRKVIINLLQSSQSRGVLQLPDITFETDIIDDLGLDSIEVMDLASAISIEFGVSPDGEINKLKNVKDIVSFLVEKAES